MKIIDLNEENKPLFNVCLEDWSDEMKEAGNHKELWCAKMWDKGLRVKLALDDCGEVGGMIQYIPIEHSAADGKDLYFILCVWVHGYKKGRGNFQKSGMGQALLAAAEDDVKSLGAKGIAAWGVPMPFWMRASWFKKHGYAKADGQGFMGPVLLWKSFDDNAIPPKWIERKKKPVFTSGKVNVTVLVNGWCPAMNLIYERAKRAAAQFGGRVEFVGIDTSDRETFLEWGISDALFIDGKEIRTGPPPSFEKIFKKIEKLVRKLG